MCPQFPCSTVTLGDMEQRRNFKTPLLMQLHLLPIAERITFKIALLTFSCLHDLSPSYIKELLTLYCPARMLRSSSTLLLARTDYNMTTVMVKGHSRPSPPLNFGISYLMT